MRRLCEIWNDYEHPMTVFIEPWGSDYTLAPRERVMIMVAADELQAYPSLVVESAETMSLYIEGIPVLEPGGATYQVVANGQVVACGYQRPASWNDGVPRGRQGDPLR